jgi:hypothetical protein
VAGGGADTAMTITGWDDYLIHQTADPVLRPAVPDDNWMDRFYWNVHDPDGRIAIGVGFGQYRNTGRMDAVLYVLLPQQQRILRLARRTTPDDFADPVIGPLRFTVQEPLRRWRWQLGPSPLGLEWDLQFTAPREPVEFAPFVFGDGIGNRSEFRHFVQLGACTGEIRSAGATIELRDAPTIRDRSWGLRRARERQGLHLWLQHHFEVADVHLVFNEARDGSVAYCDGAVVDASGARRVTAVGHELWLTPGTRDVEGGVVTIEDELGRRHTITYQRILRGYVGGVGYGGWAGADHGDRLETVETFDLSVPVQETLAAQPLLLFDHICAVQLDDGPAATGSLQIGISRSSQYEYRPRVLDSLR